MAAEVANRAYVLDDGRVVHHCDAAQLIKDEDQIRALAGASVEDWHPGNSH
jgi:branched-chain amino acid transport system ATP-binding protein